MDRERAKELLPIIQAFAEGKKVELALFDDDGAYFNVFIQVKFGYVSIDV